VSAAVLTGYKCNYCRQTYLNSSDLCGKCGSTASLFEFELPDDGSIVTFTTVWRGVDYLPQPYTLAVIDLGGEIQVLGRVKRGGQGIAINQKVRYAGKDEYGHIFELS
jgi:uncharacterized OB-fold protein